MRPWLDGAKRPFRGVAAVVTEGDDPWSPERIVSRDGNRWSRAGQPTVYLAGDPGVAMAEAGRHLPPGEPIRPASLWMVRVHVDDAVDLRDDAVAAELGIGDDPAWILDRERCRRLATATRCVGVSALIVPSVAFLDDEKRFDLVLFAECLPGGIEAALIDPQRVATLAPGTLESAGSSRPAAAAVSD